MNRPDALQMFGILIARARARRPVAVVIPLPEKTWQQCYLIDAGFYQLHYHIVGDKSSKMIAEKI